MNRDVEKWTMNRAFRTFIVLTFLCVNTGRCLREEGDGRTDSPVPIVLWHGMGKFLFLLSAIIIAHLCVIFSLRQLLPHFLYLQIDLHTFSYIVFLSSLSFYNYRLNIIHHKINY